ncbi:MAG: hypothetical protein H7842_10710 [Gammaproteobacteria bacterium SHHR-1]
MSYTRPAYNAADATWQGADAYTRSAFDAADATFQSTAQTLVEGTLSASLPLSLPGLSLAASGAAVEITSGTLAATLPVPSLPLSLSAAGYDYLPTTEYTRPAYNQADATWWMASPYTRPAHDQADAAFMAVDSIPGRLTASLPAPSLPLTLSATGERDRDWLYTSLPVPSLPISLDGAADYLHSATLAVSLPVPSLLLTLHARERSIDVTVAVTLPAPSLPLTLAAQADYIHASALAITLPPALLPITLTATADQDKAMTDAAGPYNGRMGYADMQGRIGTGAAVQQQSGLKIQRAAQAWQQQAIPTASPLQAQQQQMQPIRTSAELIEQSSIHVTASTRSPHTETIRTRRPTTGAWAEMIRTSANTSAGHAETIRTSTRSRQDSQESLPIANPLAWIIHQALTTTNRLGVDWAQMIPVQPGLWWPWYNPPLIVDYIRLQQCGEYTPRPLECRVVLGYGYPEQPPCGDEPTIPVQRTYIVIHNISVTRLSDGLPIDVESVNLSLDADAWSWGFSANLIGKNALTAVKPSVLGEPVTLAVTINDVIWHVIVEDWSENRSFANRSISVQGRGLTAELADPYQLPASGVTTQNWDVHQLMEHHLPLGSGWTVSWTTGLANWQVPAGAWSWQNQTPITAIHAIAQECGMVVVPDTDSRTLVVQPRYKFMPWAYSSETPDLIIPDSAVLSYQRQNSIPAQANSVYVHGEEVGGIVGYCVLDGTAGDKVLSTYNSKLITHTDGAYLVGSRLLAGQYKQPEVRSITMTMGGAFPLGQIGQLVKLNLEAVDHYGIINSVSLQANASTVRQTITFGENTTNQWALFKTLLPGDPLLLGTVIDNSADGTVTAQLVDGTSIRVKGTDAIGTKVWMRSGRVEGAAPNLTQHPITIY